VAEQASDAAAPLAIAARLFSAIEAGRLDLVAELYAPDIVVWHNTDGVEQTGDENLRTLEWVVEHLRDLHYDAIRRFPTDDGFVQLHVLRATNRAGSRVAVPACMVGTLVDGLITRLDEYLDSRHVELLMER